jgi:hypothetical protein
MSRAVATCNCPACDSWAAAMARSAARPSPVRRPAARPGPRRCAGSPRPAAARPGETRQRGSAAPRRCARPEDRDIAPAAPGTPAHARAGSSIRAAARRPAAPASAGRRPYRSSPVSSGRAPPRSQPASPHAVIPAAASSSATYRHLVHPPARSLRPCRRRTATPATRPGAPIRAQDVSAWCGTDETQTHGRRRGHGDYRGQRDPRTSVRVTGDLRRAAHNPATPQDS